jgi:hypothetical protein
MNRLYYVWTEGHQGATGMGPSGPMLLRPVLAKSVSDARAQAQAQVDSWTGPIRKITTDPDYVPGSRVEW